MKKTAKDVSQFANDTYYDNDADVETTTVILRDVAEMTHTINTKILPDVTDLLANAKAALSVVQSMQKDVDMLAQSTDADLKAFKPVLDNAAATLASLNTAIRTNSRKWRS